MKFDYFKAFFLHLGLWKDVTFTLRFFPNVLNAQTFVSHPTMYLNTHEYFLNAYIHTVYMKRQKWGWWPRFNVTGVHSSSQRSLKVWQIYQFNTSVTSNRGYQLRSCSFMYIYLLPKRYLVSDVLGLYQKFKQMSCLNTLIHKFILKTSFKTVDYNSLCN